MPSSALRCGVVSCAGATVQFFAVAPLTTGRSHSRLKAQGSRFQVPGSSSSSRSSARALHEEGGQRWGGVGPLLSSLSTALLQETAERCHRAPTKTSPPIHHHRPRRVES
ncbi:uncharacterized protein SPSK_08106 [Sporothrix schenckii 1099-18]|uniref:Uncharacterized protein n=1 Tax=Sporothrix schenckii 1099-18 TaxID=1397361 RepID=A0A0F2MGW9_SPOSC|nr:uncharacterized protein SPSK_08106 [Sporothrix schenckii 1099-18]KJR88085.1 hypothetical protein SPSK_08106 [Sporothrix schenckii 1099-18]